MQEPTVGLEGRRPQPHPWPPGQEEGLGVEPVTDSQWSTQSRLSDGAPATTPEQRG